MLGNYANYCRYLNNMTQYALSIHKYIYVTLLITTA